MTIPNKPGYDHGSNGTEPASAIDYGSGDPVAADEFDYFINTEFEYIKLLIDALNAFDSDNDEKVDAADTADDATNVTGTYKGNDIDVDGDGVVNRADQVSGADGSYHNVGSLPEFSDNSTAVSNTSEGDMWYNTSDNWPYINNGGSAQHLTSKSVDILVNGSQQNSFSQRLPNGDYDVSITATPTSSDVNVIDQQDYFISDGEFMEIELDLIGTAVQRGNSITVEMNTTNDSVALEVYKNRTLVASGDNNTDVNWTGTASGSDTVTITMDNGQGTFAGNVFVTATMNLKTGANFSVNGVTQTTND